MATLKLFRHEHERAVETFYGSATNYSPLLGSLGATLEREVLPVSERFDSGGGGISSARSLLFRQGVCRMPFGSYGGLSLPFGIYCLAMELAAAADAPSAMSAAIHNTVAEGIHRFGDDHQKAEFLGKLGSGELLASFALTEPASGSDAARMSTVATREGGDYVIDGVKTFITNAGEADLYLVFARDGGGHSAFLVDRASPGLSVGREIQKLGMRGSRTAEVRFDGCRVPAGRLLGEGGRALDYVKGMLNASRIVMASICVGIALVAYRKALGYSLERVISGRPLAEFQATREKVADMRSGITSARLTYLYASRLKDIGVEYASEAAQAKVIASEMSVRTCDQAIQLLGGYGYTNGDVHRHWRDARLLTIGEGASEVLRMLIAGKEFSDSR